MHQKITNQKPKCAVSKSSMTKKCQKAFASIGHHHLAFFSRKCSSEFRVGSNRKKHSGSQFLCHPIVLKGYNNFSLLPAVRRYFSNAKSFIFLPKWITVEIKNTRRKYFIIQNKMIVIILSGIFYLMN